jgi:hypothetical protein
MTVKVDVPGDELDFTLASFLMPVVRRSVGDLVASIAREDVQRIPVDVEGATGEFEILNVVHTHRCVDERRTQHVEKWTEDDFRSDLAGEYSMVLGLRVLPDALMRTQITRVWGYEVILICSGTIKSLLESHGVTGISYVDVT